MDKWEETSRTKYKKRDHLKYIEAFNWHKGRTVMINEELVGDKIEVRLEINYIYTVVATVTDTLLGTYEKLQKGEFDEQIDAKIKEWEDNGWM